MGKRRKQKVESRMTEGVEADIEGGELPAAPEADPEDAPTVWVDGFGMDRREAEFLLNGLRAGWNVATTPAAREVERMVERIRAAVAAAEAS